MDKKLSKNNELQLAATNVNFTEEVNSDGKANEAVRATAARAVKNTHGTRGQIASVKSQTTVSKHGVNKEVNFTSVDVTRDAKGNATNTDLTVAKMTSDAHGNTTITAITTAGAGQTVKIPIKRNKEIGGLQVTYDATAISEDEHGNKRMHLYFSVATYSKSIRAEKLYAFEKAMELSLQVQNHIPGICMILGVIHDTLLLVFFIFQFLYPLIAFLIERKFALYNLICIMVGAIGTIKEFTDIDLLYKDYKAIYHCYCCSHNATETIINDDDPGCYATFKKRCQKYCVCCPLLIRKLVKETNTEILLYIAVICNIMGFINEQTWQLKDALDYLDCFLLLYSVIEDVLSPRYNYLKWSIAHTNRLYRDYFKACHKKQIEFSYKMFGRCVNPLRLSPLFILGITLLHFVMLALITVGIYADNYLGIANTTINGSEYLTEIIVPDEGSYNVTLYTWLAILGGILIPFLSIITYLIINQYWIWQPLHYIKNHTSNSRPKPSYIETMTYVDKWTIYIFDPIAWFAMFLLFSLFIGFAIVTEGYDYQTNFAGGGIPNSLQAVHIICYVSMFLIFIGANAQTFAFFLLLCTFPCLCCLLPLHFVFHRPKNRLHNF